MTEIQPGPVACGDAPADDDSPKADYKPARAVGTNATWLLLQRGAELAIRFLIGAWLVRYLGPEQFGIYAYAVSLSALFLQGAGLGLDQVVIRDLAVRQREQGEVLATAAALRVAAAVIGFVFLCGLAMLTEADVRVRTAVIILAGQLLLSPGLMFELWFHSQMQSRYAVWSRMTSTMIVALVQGWFIMAGLPLTAFTWLIVLQLALTIANLYLAFRVVGPRSMAWSTSRSLAVSMLRSAWPLLIANLAIAIYMRIDQVMLGRLVGVDAVGAYGAAVKVSELWNAVPMAVVISAFPLLLALRRSGPPGEYPEAMQSLYDLLALYSFGVISAVWLTAPLIVSLLFGPAFSAAVPLLRVHVVSLLFVSLGVVYMRWLTAENLTIFAMISTCLGAAGNVLLNLWLIPLWGAVGAAVATVVSHAAATYACPIAVPRLRPVRRQLSSALSAPFRARAVVRHAIEQCMGRSRIVVLGEPTSRA